MSSAYSNNQVTRRIQEADRIKEQLSEFIRYNSDVTTFVSLGENCSTAWYLKQVGLKRASYPFDWIFSSPDIVLDCINDNFKRYLDKSLITPKRKKKSAGHNYYHDNFFNHRNPLASDEDYNYHQRCCNRFTELLVSKSSCCYLITLINEPQNRVDWASGFTKNFSMPRKQSLTSLEKLIGALKDKNENSIFIIIDHYTNSDRHTFCRKVANDVFFIEYHAHSKSNGVVFLDPLDDFCFKQALVGLYGKSIDMV